MLQVPRSQRLVVAFCLAASVWGCGKVEYSSKSYEPDGLVAKTGPNTAYLGLAPTRSETGGLFGHTIRIGEPYKATLLVEAGHDYPDPVQLLSLVIEREGTSKVIHDRSAPASTASFIQQPGGSNWDARIEQPLGGELVFAEGSKVTVTAVVRLPYEAGETTITREFHGKSETARGANIDYYTGQ